jgi:hypothetical protein
MTTVSRCYLCYDRPAERVTRDFPVCGRCDDRYMGVAVSPPPPKAPAEVISTAYGNLYMLVWRLGGCVLCGSTTDPRPPGNKMSHGVCYRASSEGLRKLAEEAVEKEKKGSEV